MKKNLEILCIADHVDPLVYSASVKERFGHVDAVISCGDLKRDYYEFIVSMLNIPFIYVLGNHSPFTLDEEPYGSSDYVMGGMSGKPEAGIGRKKKSLFYGGRHVDGRCLYFKKLDLIVCGAGGSIRYNRGENQYTEFEMFMRIFRMIPTLIWNRIFHGRFLDVFVTHAPPRWVNDREDICHQGFKVFRWFLKKFKPTCMIHGHVHLYDCNAVRETEFAGVPVINVYDHYMLKLPLEKKSDEEQ